MKKIRTSNMTLYLAVIGLVVFLLSLGSAVDPAAGAAGVRPLTAVQSLTVAERVDCQTTIQQLYWDEMDWPEVNPEPKPALASMIGDGQIEGMVQDTLGQSLALQQKWGLTVTAEMLQSELNRMAANSQSPDRLQDLFTALGNDPTRIAECLVRPALVERLILRQYGFDAAIHAGTRAEAEADLAGLTTAGEAAALSNAEIVTWVKTAGDEDEILELEKTNDGEIALAEAAYDARIQEARDAFNLDFDEALPLNVVSPLNENDGRFFTIAILEAAADRLQVVYTTWDKQPFESWWVAQGWAANKDAFTVDAFVQPTQSYTLPAIQSNAEFGGGGDAWQYMPAMPWATASSRSVWTGSVMLVWGGDYTTNGFRYDPVLDDWRPITTLNAPYGRTGGFTAVWSGTEMIVFGGCNGGSEFCTDGSGGRYNPATDTWASMASGASRRQHTAVWSGAEMLVWGGCREDANGNQNCNILVTQGARYNPATNSWSNMTLSGAPGGARYPSSVWAGDQMIIWNGTGGVNGRYFPATDSWQTISSASAPPALLPTLVWTGSEMIAWGGCTGAGLCNTLYNEGGRYNPAADSWTPTSLTNAPSPRSYHTAVWTGSEMIIWGGSGGPGVFLNDGGRYNPATDSWTDTGTTGAPTSRAIHKAHWTGQEMIIWGGDGQADERTGGRYNPTADSWTPTTTNDPYRVANIHSSIWDGTQMISWGGEGEQFIDPFYQRARLYDPATDVWSMSSQNSDLLPFWWPTAVWTGSEMLIWGGQYGSSTSDEGARYNPLTDSWSMTSLVGAPEARALHSGVWSGSELIIFGGSTWTDLGVNTGGRYNPATDSWTATTLIGAPSARNLHEAVWTGDRMIVWGGRQVVGTSTNTGALYDPATNSWQAMSTSGAPDGRIFYAHTWTGSEFLVWGGGFYFSGWTYFQDGALYDPATNSWTPTNNTNAPQGSARLDSVWTGEELVVWGGCNGSNCLTDIHTGGRYNPVTESWTPTTTDYVIEGREFHTMVWTGSEIIVWGGQTDRNGYTHIGGRYTFPFSGNTAPQANADSYSVQANTTLTVTAPGVLANDIDVNNDPLTATLVTTPTSGSLTFNGDGSFVYVPATDFSGLITFHYRVTDGIAQSNVAPVTVNVMPEPNQAPVAVGDAYTTTMNLELTVGAPGLLANDSDPDGDPLTAVLVSAPANGQLSLGANGSFSYLPNAEFTGQDSFTYQAFDGLDYSDPVLVTIEVEAGPPTVTYSVFMPVVLRP